MFKLRLIATARLFCAFLCAHFVLAFLPAFALDVPPLTGRIVDRAQLLPADVAASLTADLAAHEQRTGNQIALLTLPSLEGEPLEAFSHRVATTWKLGQKPTDNGVLLLVVPGERRIRIEVGYGLEGTLTDAATSRIIRDVIVPRFQAGDFRGGLAEGLNAIMGTIEGTYTPPAQSRGRGEDAHGIGQVFIIAVVVGVLIGSMVGKYLKGLGSGIGALLSFVMAASSGWIIAIAAAVVAMIAVLVMAGLSTGRRASPGGWDGGWGPGFGGGFGGGGGGFSSSDSFCGGGGGFGGGGASGRW